MGRGWEDSGAEKVGFIANRPAITPCGKRPAFPFGICLEVKGDDVVRFSQRWRWRKVGFADGGKAPGRRVDSGASVAVVARAHGVNANQVFKWHRGLEAGELVDSAAAHLGV